MAICANGEEGVVDSANKWESFHSLLEKLFDELNEGNEKMNIIGDLSLNVVYECIVFGMLHCIPNSEKLLRADTHLRNFEPLLRGLKLSDLYYDTSKGGLQRFLFNLPQGMLNDVMSYRSHCVPAMVENENNNRNGEEGMVKWTTAPRKYSTISELSPLLASTDSKEAGQAMVIHEAMPRNDNSSSDNNQAVAEEKGYEIMEYPLTSSSLPKEEKVKVQEQKEEEEPTLVEWFGKTITQLIPFAAE
mmetsp:Transcript_9160/g.19794  ORF Transcript_9160/g.19794 Transcript_9160/m.19794 type:complete len:246 (-) Transcript_9160:216-953(-)